MSNDVAPPLAAGRLRLRRVLGVGGVGTVYEAYDQRLDVARAVKVLSRERASNAIQRQRFLTEARIQARLRHPNVVEVYDIEDDGQDVYMVMELVPGGSLWDWLRAHGPLAPRAAVEMIVGILDALQQAHAMDVVHRDIKPHNILLTAEGRPKLADFGVAQQQGPEQQDITRTGMVMGTWAFMAPEQRVSSRRVDRRSDLYGVGATLFTLLTDSTEPDLFDFDPDSEVYAPLPPPLRPVIRRATRYARAERHDTAEALRADLLAVLPLMPERGPAPTDPMDAPDPPAHLTPERAAGAPALASHGLRPFTEGARRPAGTLVPSLSEVDRLLATPPAGMDRPTFSDERHTVEVPRGPAPGDPPAEPSPVILPITEEQDPARHITWTVEDEQSLEGDAPLDPVDRPRRKVGWPSWLAIAILGAVGAGLWLAVRHGGIPPLFVAHAPDPGAAHERAAHTAHRPTSSPPVVPPSADPSESVSLPPGTAPVVHHVAPPKDPVAPSLAQRVGPTPPPEAPEALPPITPPEPAELVPGTDPFAGMSIEEIRRVVRIRNEPQIFACYEEALSSNPRLQGTLTLRWRVEDGAVVAAAAIQTPGDHQDLRACAVAAISTWRYPAGFDDSPPSQDWELNPARRTSALALARIDSLRHCIDDLPPEQQPAPGAGTLSLSVVEGVTREAHWVRPFGAEAYDACVLADVREWMFPAWGSGNQVLEITVSAQ